MPDRPAANAAWHGVIATGDAGFLRSIRTDGEDLDFHVRDIPVECDDVLGAAPVERAAIGGQQPGRNDLRRIACLRRRTSAEEQKQADGNG